jgi:hypothetical protein
LPTEIGKRLGPEIAQWRGTQVAERLRAGRPFQGSRVQVGQGHNVTSRRWFDRGRGRKVRQGRQIEIIQG